MQESRSTTPIVIVHGGAWSGISFQRDARADGAKHAAIVGWKRLEETGNAIDAAEAAVCSLEDDPIFDAGTGSVLNSSGHIEMDAVIMDGATLNSGGVACVRNIKNPVTLARKVMENTHHCLLVGEGANQFAEKVGIHTIPEEQLLSELSVTKLKLCEGNYGDRVGHAFKAKNVKKTHEHAKGEHDTVGAVVIDAHGNVAAATSTGGITAKMAGRVGDSPLIGLGCYGDNVTGGVSCTGHGESIMKVHLASRIIMYMDAGLGPKDAAEKALDYMYDRTEGAGGVIVLDNKGNFGVHYTTGYMAWACIRDNKLHHGISGHENHTEELPQNMA
ncbi:PREDICTED: isoaspartyl peptidase/L-asparaginase-like [Priapulus caudatus]|uniref:Isoaspartyl peptidase/L-asparaginase-like n=1 Tax=Priapulus caudatus TaxID=37621 RepID=A0ABM1DXG0_PRICU|nr:PREDICTED: isoaspartyl peptidase/L-asparaginase-like [Priapulus caudatus]XP_014664631.1 PREDICTED: isoaspartyl peptidase/L-asparaginase-like [Priapulus caudatus]